MEHRTYYYARVSTKEQNLDRQLAAFRSLGASEREIITDKESGKDLDRKGYQALKSTILRSADTHRRAFSIQFAEIIDNGIFYFV